MTRDQRTFDCADCGTSFQVPYGTGRPAECPSCHGANFNRAAEPGGRRNRGHAGRGQCRRRRGGIWAIPSNVAIVPAEEDSQ